MANQRQLAVNGQLPGMENDDEFIATTLTCSGNISDPHFPYTLKYIKKKLQKILETGEQRFHLLKVEPWNSVRVTFNIPREAAQRLRLLAERGDRTLQDLGILSVQIEGDRLISLIISGRNNETQEIILRTEEGTDSNVSVFDHSSSDDMSSPGPGNVENTRKHIAQYLNPQGATVTSNLFVQPTSSSSQGECFKSPNVVAPSCDPIPFPPPTPRPPFPPVRSNLGPFPFASMTHAMNTKANNQSSPLPRYPVVSSPQAPRLNYSAQSPHLNNIQRLPSDRNVALSSPLLVNLLQSDMSPKMPPPLSDGPPKRKRQPRKSKDKFAESNHSPRLQHMVNPVTGQMEPVLCDDPHGSPSSEDSCESLAAHSMGSPTSTDACQLAVETANRPCSVTEHPAATSYQDPRKLHPAVSVSSDCRESIYPAINSSILQRIEVGSRTDAEISAIQRSVSQVSLNSEIPHHRDIPKQSHSAILKDQLMNPSGALSVDGHCGAQVCHVSRQNLSQQAPIQAPDTCANVLPVKLEERLSSNLTPSCNWKNLHEEKPPERSLVNPIIRTCSLSKDLPTSHVEMTGSCRSLKGLISPFALDTRPKQALEIRRNQFTFKNDRDKLFTLKNEMSLEKCEKSLLVPLTSGSVIGSSESQKTTAETTSDRHLTNHGCSSPHLTRELCNHRELVINKPENTLLRHHNSSIASIIRIDKMAATVPKLIKVPSCGEISLPVLIPSVGEAVTFGLTPEQHTVEFSRPVSVSSIHVSVASSPLAPDSHSPANRTPSSESLSSPDSSTNSPLADPDLIISKRIQHSAILNSTNPVNDTSSQPEPSLSGVNGDASQPCQNHRSETQITNESQQTNSNDHSAKEKTNFLELSSEGGHEQSISSEGESSAPLSETWTSSKEPSPAPDTVACEEDGQNANSIVPTTEASPTDLNTKSTDNPKENFHSNLISQGASEIFDPSLTQSLNSDRNSTSDNGNKVIHIAENLSTDTRLSFSQERNEQTHSENSYLKKDVFISNNISSNNSRTNDYLFKSSSVFCNEIIETESPLNISEQLENKNNKQNESDSTPDNLENSDISEKTNLLEITNSEELKKLLPEDTRKIPDNKTFLVNTAPISDEAMLVSNSPSNTLHENNSSTKEDKSEDCDILLPITSPTSINKTSSLCKTILGQTRPLSNQFIMTLNNPAQILNTSRLDFLPSASSLSDEIKSFRPLSTVLNLPKSAISHTGLVIASPYMPSSPSIGSFQSSMIRPSSQIWQTNSTRYSGHQKQPSLGLVKSNALETETAVINTQDCLRSSSRSDVCSAEIIKSSFSKEIAVSSDSCPKTPVALTSSSVSVLSVYSATSVTAINTLPLSSVRNQVVAECHTVAAQPPATDLSKTLDFGRQSVLPYLSKMGLPLISTAGNLGFSNTCVTNSLSTSISTTSTVCLTNKLSNSAEVPSDTDTNKFNFEIHSDSDLASVDSLNIEDTSKEANQPQVFSESNNESTSSTNMKVDDSLDIDNVHSESKTQLDNAESSDKSSASACISDKQNTPSSTLTEKLENPVEISVSLPSFSELEIVSQFNDIPYTPVEAVSRESPNDDKIESSNQIALSSDDNISAANHQKENENSVESPDTEIKLLLTDSSEQFDNIQVCENSVSNESSQTVPSESLNKESNYETAENLSATHSSQQPEVELTSAEEISCVNEVVQSSSIINKSEKVDSTVTDNNPSVNENELSDEIRGCSDASNPPVSTASPVCMTTTITTISINMSAAAATTTTSTSETNCFVTTAVIPSLPPLVLPSTTITTSSTISCVSTSVNTTSNSLTTNTTSVLSTVSSTPMDPPSPKAESKLLTDNVTGQLIVEIPYEQSTSNLTVEMSPSDTRMGTRSIKRKASELEEKNAKKKSEAEEIVTAFYSKPLKRKCSENAAELIKACMGLEDNPKKISTSRSKSEELFRGPKDKQGEENKNIDSIRNLKNIKGKKESESLINRQSRNSEGKGRKTAQHMGDSGSSSEDDISLSELAHKSRAKIRSNEDHNARNRRRSSRDFGEESKWKSKSPETNNEYSYRTMSSKSSRRDSWRLGDNYSDSEGRSKHITRDFRDDNKKAQKRSLDRSRKSPLRGTRDRSPPTSSWRGRDRPLHWARGHAHHAYSAADFSRRTFRSRDPKDHYESLPAKRRRSRDHR